MWASWIEVSVLAVALALDAVAVTTSLGAARASIRTLWVASFTFGVFQAGMSGLGAVGGSFIATHAAAWDHWVAFTLLVIVGGRMVVGVSEDEDEETSGEIGLLPLLGLAVATSIDALAAGVTLPLFELPLWAVLTTIGVVTLGLSMVGGLAGRRLGAHLGVSVERIGGVALILIGIRILVEHLTT